MVRKNVSKISKEDLNTIKKHYQKLAKLFETEKNIKQSHSIAEAKERSQRNEQNK